MRIGFLVLLVVSCVLGAASCATTPTPVLPANVQWSDSAVLPGVKRAVLDGNPNQPGLSTWRALLPANYKIAPHYHSVTEYVTVISGTLYNGDGETFDTRHGTAYPAGSFFVTAANARHYNWTTDQGAVLQVSVMGPFGMTFVNPADDPRRK